MSDLGRKSFVNCPKDRNGFKKGQKIGSFGKNKKIQERRRLYLDRRKVGYWVIISERKT